MERVDKEKDQQPLTSSLKKWTADDLKNIAYISKKKRISKLEVFGSLMWTAIWATLYFYANQLLGVYEENGGRLEFITPSLNQEVLIQYWPIVVIIIGLEIALALNKLMKEQWTKRMAIFNAVIEIISVIVFIIIITNPNLLSETFIEYMTDVFKITKDKLNFWIVGGGIIILTFSAATNIYDGFKKVRVRSLN